MRDLELARLEHRPTRSYDEQDPGTVLLPNGTRAATFDRALMGGLLRAAVREWRETENA